MTKILLADDHAIIRTGLKTFISAHLPHAVIDEAFDGTSALAKIKQVDYDLVVMDVNMPETDSFALVHIILAVKPLLNILIFSMNAEELYAKKFLMIGAKGFLSKTAPESEMKDALDAVINGNKYMSATLKNALTEEALGKRAFNPFDNLSKREFEIAMYLIKGASVAEMSETLHLHTSTIGTHKARVFEKLHCKNIIDVGALAKVYNVVPSA